MARGSDITRNPNLIVGERTPFAGSFLTIDPNVWEIIQTGDSQSLTVDGGTDGSRYLKMSSGTTPNAETIIRSVEMFKPPFELTVHPTISQRIANFEAFIELVEVDANGDVYVEPSNTYPTPHFSNARNGVQLYFDGTTVGAVGLRVREDGLPGYVQANVFGTSATNGVATGTAPALFAQQAFELQLTSDVVQVVANGINSTNTGTNVLRRQRVPNPNVRYAIQFRIKNGSTAPASNTDFLIHAVRVIDQTRVNVEFGTVQGTADGQRSVPAIIVNQPSILMETSPSFYSETTTALGASASFTGSSRDMTSTNRGRYFAVAAYSDQAGTLTIQASTDGTTFREVGRVPITAAQGATLQVPVTARYYRVVYINGATAQTTFWVTSAVHKL